MNGSGTTAAAVEQAIRTACPICGKQSEREGVRVDSWEYRGSTRKRVFYNVRTAMSAGLCGRCDSSLLKKRIAGTALMVAPIPALAYLTRTAENYALALIPLILYSIYFLRWLRYGWGDFAAYGIGLRSHLAGSILHSGAGAEKVRLPVSSRHAIARAAAAAGLLYLALALPVPVPGKGEFAVAEGRPAVLDDPAGLRPVAEKLFGCVLHKDVPGAAAILEEHPGLVNYRRRFDGALLHYAVRHPKMLELLLAHGANVDIVHPKNGRTALHFAVEAKRPDIVARLVEAGAGLDVRDRSGKTPLELARMRRHQPTLAVLETRSGSE